MVDPYATNETHAQLWFEQSIDAGTQIGSMAYGVHVSVFFTCLYFILQERKTAWRSLAFICSLLVLATIEIACNINFNEQTWIDERNYPGGPFAFMMEQEARPVDTVGNSAGIIITFLANGLLMFRAFIMWERNWKIIVVPALMYFASTALSILVVFQAARPESSLWAQNTLNISVPYWSVTMSLNIILTIMIVSRLLWMRKTIQSTLGSEYGKTYTGVAAMVVESALPYGLISFVFIILYARKVTAANLFIPLLTQIECIAPDLIILRVARGRAWSKDTLTSAPTGSISFRPFHEKKRVSMKIGISQSVLSEV